MASDSATTQSLALQDGSPFTGSIWNTANKIINLRKGMPIGVMTFGCADFANRAIATHLKDLRAKLSGDLPDDDYPAIGADYTIEEVAQTLERYFKPLFNAQPGDIFGLMVGGYSTGAVSPEVWQVMMTGDGNSAVSCLTPAGAKGILHQGMTDAVSRLVDGAGQRLDEVLVSMGAGQQTAFIAQGIRENLSTPLAWHGMPLGESIDLARFLVSTTINYVRFAPGDLMVGGPIEIAAITRHEGFKWVDRKHYYSPHLNPHPEA